MTDYFIKLNESTDKFELFCSTDETCALLGIYQRYFQAEDSFFLREYGGRTKKTHCFAWNKELNSYWLKPRVLATTKIGYHLTSIPKGELGKVSKIVEEALELQDADEQGAKIMCLIELSDLIGAIEAYMGDHFTDITFDDLVKMKDITKRAFESGERQ